jgi:hypothetical protein
VIDFEVASTEATSQRDYARQHDVPRTTLQYWLARKQALDASPATVTFFESLDGIAFLHRLTAALQFVVTYVGANGLRSVQKVIELAGLQPFVANSFGSRQKLGQQMEKHLGEFGRQQREELAAHMAPKQITVCEDETFHPATCLVAIEPVSNFILVEAYADRRDAATWNAALQQGLQGLPVRVIQSTSDEGKGLLAHVRDGLCAHHSPDLFHAQQELTRATSIALSARVRHAEQAARDALVDAQTQRQAAQSWAQVPHGPGRPPDFAVRTAEAQLVQFQAEQALQVARRQQERAKSAIGGIGQAYHPVSLATGAPQSAAQGTQKLEQHFAEIAQVAQEASLPARCLQKIAKAHRLVPALGCTLAFFHEAVHARLVELALPPAVLGFVEQSLVPAAYLERAAKKAQPAEARAPLRERADALRTVPEAVAALLAELGPAQRTRLDSAVTDCADLFQRSSSCVEGRNGQLSLRHHCLHNISPNRLAALSHVHNYFLTRPEGTTAAQRFFGAPHADLFASLLEHLPMPSRPAARRRPPSTPPTSLPN